MGAYPAVELPCHFRSEEDLTNVKSADIMVRIPSEAHWPSVVLGLLVMVLMIGFKKVKMLASLPAAMIMVLLGIIVSWALDLGNTYGFIVAGAVPSGIPAPSMPQFPSSEHLGQVLTLSVVCTLIGYMESMAVGMVYAGKNGYELAPDQELVALGMANLVGSFFSCYPTFGGFGRTAVAAKSGNSPVIRPASCLASPCCCSSSHHLRLLTHENGLRRPGVSLQAAKRNSRGCSPACSCSWFWPF